MNFSFTGGSGLMDRVTAPDEPGYGGSSGREEAAVEFAYWQAGLLGDYKNYYENVVTAQTALTYSAVWACVRWVSQTLAMLPWLNYERQGKSRKEIDLTDDVSWIIGHQANPETTAFEWKQVMLNHALTDGNGYSEIERDGFGRLYWVWQLGRGRCAPDRTSSGRLIYEVENGSGVKNTILDPSQVFHLKGLGDDGLIGYSVIGMARRTINVARHQQSFGDEFFSRGPTPGGIFTSKAKLGPVQEEQARKAFDSLYSGRKNIGRVIRVTGDATFTPLSLPNDDAQFLESQRFSVEEIARIYGVPLHKIQSMDAATNNNIEQQAIEAVQDCLMPWASRLQTEADVKFYGRVNRGKRFTEFNFGKLLRGDTASQADALSKQVNGGITTPNEAREELGKNPVPGADELLVQGAMVSMDRALNPPEPVAPKPAPAQPDQKQPDEPSPDGPPDQLAAAFGKLLADAYGKQLRVEADKAKRAANKRQLAAWADTFYASSAPRQELTEALTPIFAAFLIASGRNSIAPSELASAAAERHVAWSKQILTSAGAVPDDWSGRAPELAQAELKLAWENSR